MRQKTIDDHDPLFLSNRVKEREVLGEFITQTPALKCSCKICRWLMVGTETATPFNPCQSHSMDTCTHTCEGFPPKEPHQEVIMSTLHRHVAVSLKFHYFLSFFFVMGKLTCILNVTSNY